MTSRPSTRPPIPSAGDPSLDLSVVLPAFPEEENLRLLLPRIRAVCAELTDAYEIVVVDAATELDGTRRLCADQGVRHVTRVGGDQYGDAVRTGIAQARGRRVVFMDADGSHAPDFLAQLWAHREDADIVIASRYVEGGSTENSAALVLMSRLVNVGYRWVLGLKCRDVSNSFKLYPADALKGVTLTCDNFDVVEELLYKIVKVRPRTRILEIPFTFRKRLHGETKRDLVAFVFSYATTLARLRLGR